MSEKTLKTRIQNKRGTTAEWATGTAPNFVPKDGEIVAYTDVHRIKIGDGSTKVSALPFVDKVRDVTLDGTSIVNADGVVELHPTAMTDGYVPVWNNTTKVFEDGIKKTNIVTLDTDQSLTGHKTFDAGFTTTAFAAFNASATFNEDLTLACPIMINNSAGTAGQVLTSQGSNKTPIWKTFTASAPSNMVTTDTTQTITGNKTFSSSVTTNSNLNVYATMDIDNSNDGMTFYNSNSSLGVTLKLDESYSPEQAATVRLPAIESSSASTVLLVSSGGTGTKGQVLTSDGGGNAATWSTLPEFAMNIALPISYRISTSSNGYYSSVSYGTASTVNCLMTRDVPNHTSLNRHISYCIHLSTTIAAGKWVRFDVPSISYNNTTYHPYIKSITASAIRSNTNTTPPSLVTYTSNNQSSGSMAYIGCCSQQISGLEVRIDCIVS